MGMFDYVKVKGFKLPRPAKNITGWQTKDFDCTMEQFEIRKDGRFYKQVVAQIEPRKWKWIKIVPNFKTVHMVGSELFDDRERYVELRINLNYRGVITSMAVADDHIFRLHSGIK